MVYQWKLDDLINKLEENKQDFERQEFQEHIESFMFHTIELFQRLIEELAKKEDVIDVNNIKEVKNING